LSSSFNRLLDHAKFSKQERHVAEETTRPVLPTTTGFSARQAIAALQNHNVAVDPLLRRVGLSERDFDNRQGRISAGAQSKLLEYAAETLNDSGFGLRLAQQANPREIGLLFYVASAAKSVSEAVALYARYCRIVNEAVRVKLLQGQSEVVVEFIFVGISRHRARQNAEFGIAAAFKALREIAGLNIHPAHVSFAHAGNANRRELERFFGCRVEFGASIDQMAFSNETLALPLVTEDRHLLETLQPICDEAAKERNTANGTLRASVENEAQRLLPHGKAQRETVAKKLAMSTRTLGRRLADENTTYEEVVDQLRRSLALQYVKEPSLSLSQIAWLLGYEGSTSFNHAFKRWTGQSPSAARNQKQLPAPG
jgi:AraC-like DNA-binding protein